MASEDAALGQPVLVRGVVTQMMPEWRGFSIQDDSDAVYVWVREARIPLPVPRERVEVRGRTGPGNFAPIIEADSVTKLGVTTYPKAALGDWSTLSSGSCDNRRIAISGVIRSVMAVDPPRWRWHGTAIHVDFGGNLVWAYVRDASALPRQDLAGAAVRLEGTCLVLSNSRRQFERNALLVADSSDIEVKASSLPDPIFFTPIECQPAICLSTTQYSSHAGPSDRNHHLDPRSTIVLQNSDGALQVRTSTDTRHRVGGCIDAVGFPTPGAFSIVLEDAVTRSCRDPALISPLRLTAAGILSRMQNANPALPDATLVRLDATVLDVSRTADEQILTLEDSDSVFTARLPAQGKSDRAITHEGARVRLSGICVIQVDDAGLARSFEIFLRSPRDIALISAASWLTRSLALRILVGLLAATLLGLLWIFLLRRRVRVQTNMIRDQLTRETALETRLRQLVEHASDMVCIVDPDGNLLHVNSGAERLTGYTREELLGKNILDLLTPDQRAQAMRTLLSSACNEAGFTQSEWHFLRKDGTEMTIELSQRMETSSDRGPRIEAIGRDVTSRNEATAEQRDRFRVLADNIPQLAWMADSNGTSIWYNHRWFEYTAISSEDLINHGWTTCVHPDHIDRVENTLVRHMLDRSPWQETFPLRSADGQFRWFLGRGVPICDSNGSVSRWFGTNTDITEQKQTESELKRSNADLQQWKCCNFARDDEGGDVLAASCSGDVQK